MLLAVGLVGCGQQPQAPAGAQQAGQQSTAAGQAAKKELTIALVPKLVHPFFEDVRIGGEKAANELGVNFLWVAPPTGDPAQQVRMIEDLVARNVDGIGISPNEPKSVEAVIADAMAKGIKVITFDADSPDSKRMMYIGTDNKAAGVVMGETMAKLIGGKGKVAIITGGLGALNLNQRIDGVKEALAKYPEIELVDLQGTDDDLAKGLAVAEAMMRAHPDLAGIFGVSATGGPSVAKALAEPEFSDRVGRLKVVAFDDLEDTKKGIADGYIQATMVQRPVQMGSLSIQWLKDIIEGKATDLKDIDTGVTVVTKENLNSYTK